MADDPFGLEKERLAELSAKRRRIAAFLAEKQLDAILIARHENIAWVTAGLVDVRVGVLRESGPASLLLTREGASYYLTTNNEAQRLAEEEFAGLDFQPVVNPWHANDLRAGREVSAATWARRAASRYPSKVCAWNSRTVR
jgi:Creatinase/Prolidase N-terminal domain